MTRLAASLRAFYSVRTLTATLVYMVQNTEYQALPYLRWLFRTEDFSRVMQRRTLEPTRAARLLQTMLSLGIAGYVVLCLLFMFAAGLSYDPASFWFGAAALAAYPLVWSLLLAAAVGLGRVFVLLPRETKQVAEAARTFQQHGGIRVAIAGSYGKTSMKELLTVVLGEGLKVAATPANMNVISSHARFARSLQGDEDAVIVEFGEGKPGDIAQFSTMLGPRYAVITGVAPAHLERYKTLEAAAKDICSIREFVNPQHIYANAESDALRPYIGGGMHMYDRGGALGWKVKNAKTGLEGTSFELVKANRRVRFQSKLIGLHQVGPLAFAAAFALKLGLTEAEVKQGIAKTAPYEHRMQPYRLGGAWIIDDTYNGNLEGIKAGAELLAGLQARRKLYVTPGLVDQGKDTAQIHRSVGRLIAGAKPDVVVLMRNSVAEHIRAGLDDSDFRGEIIIQDNPLEFYTNLASFVAAGDVVLMQNDWTDNYA